VHNGDTGRYGEVTDDDPEGAVELFEHASVDHSRRKVQIDSEDAADLYRSSSDPLAYFESAIRAIDYGSQYEAGRSSAHENAMEASMRGSSSEALENAFERLERNDKLAKASDLGAAGSGLGFIGSAAAGSVHGMGLSTTVGLISSAASARFQGGRDRWVEEAAEGLEDAYGGYRIEIV